VGGWWNGHFIVDSNNEYDPQLDMQISYNPGALLRSMVYKWQGLTLDMKQRSQLQGLSISTPFIDTESNINLDYKSLNGNLRLVLLTQCSKQLSLT
jgi:hypothetical protein